MRGLDQTAVSAALSVQLEGNDPNLLLHNPVALEAIAHKAMRASIQSRENGEEARPFVDKTSDFMAEITRQIEYYKANKRLPLADRD